MTKVPFLVVFDVDGTLVDSQDHICAAMSVAFAAVGLPEPPRARVLSIVGLSLPQAVATLAPDLAPAVQARIVAAYKASFMPQSGAKPSPLFPGALAALDSLAGRADVILAVATGKSRRGLDRLIDRHGLTGRFQSRQVADDHPSKPHPSMLLAALRETGVPADRAVMVGDTTYDIDMARAASVTAIGVSWGYHPPEALTKAGAECLIAGFADLVPALDRLWGRG